MKFKREIIAIILVICMLFMISAVSAADSLDKAVGVANATEKAVGADVANDDNLAKENDVEILGETDDGSFAALNTKISGASDNVTLENDYEYSSTDSGTNGITISSALTIDGNNHIIDAKGISRIFYVSTSNVIIKNTIFKNGFTTANGGAIYVSTNDITIINCTFINNEADNGGALYSYAYSRLGNVINSTFINNKANGQGAVIYNYADVGTLDGCTLVNNTAGTSIIYTYSAITVKNSILVNNEATNIFSASSPSITANDNWWGNTAEDYQNPPANLGSGVTADSYYVLDMALDDQGSATVTLNNLYENSVVTPDSNYDLPSIKLNVVGKGTTVDDNVVLEANGVGTFGFTPADAYEITINYNGVELTKDVKPTFALLNNKINDIGNEITLEQDYIYDSTKDSGLTNGIEFAKDMTIDGQGHILDAKQSTNIFYFNDNTDSYSLTLKNIIFANATGTNGAAVYFKGNKIEIINCSFIDNAASSQGDAVYVANAVSDENKIVQSRFINNTGSNSVVYVNLYSSNSKLNLNNSIFVGNDATYNIKGTNNVIAEYNWFGSTVENYIDNNVAKVDGATLNNWLFLKIDADSALKGTATVSLNNVYDGGQVGTYDEYSLPAITLNIGGVNTTSQVSSISLGADGQANYQFKMDKTNGSLTANYEDITTTKELEYVCVDDGSFKALNEIIWFSSENDVIDLTKDYEYSISDTITPGIQITKTITIDGHGKTIDAKGKCGIFLINSPNVEFRNIIFKNGIFETGGAIYASQNANYLTVNNCTFINNTATNTDGGAIWSGSYYFGSVVDSTFINNTAVEDGAAIFTYSYYTTAVVDRCVFINNSAPYSVIYAYYNFNPHDSIFLNNSANNVFAGRYSGYSDFNVGTNWYGNTFENYNSAMATVSVKNWLYLDIKFLEDVAIVSLNNLYTSSSSSSSVYSNYNLPKITLNINSTSLDLGGIEKITLDSTGKAIIPYTKISEDAKLTVGNDYVSLTKDCKVGDFDCLQYSIDSSTENTIELTRNYTYMEGVDSITNGVTLSKSLTIDGKGHTIDAKGLSRIFYSRDESRALNVVYKNINFANAKATHGGAVYFLGNTVQFINCTFNNSTATDNPGGAVYIDGYGSKFIDCNFTGNSIIASTKNGGAVYIYERGGVNNFTNCVFMDNTATQYGGAIATAQGKSILTIDKSIFINNKANYGFSIYCYGGSSAEFYLNNSLIFGTSLTEDTNNKVYVQNTLKAGDVNNNWWMHINDANYNKPGYIRYSGGGLTVTKWLYLDITCENELATVSLNNLFDNSAGTSSAYDGELPQITFDLSAVNAIVDSSVTLDKNGQGEVEYSLTDQTGSLTATYDVVSITKELTYDDSYTTLQSKINRALEGSELILAHGYTYDSTKDSALIDGILIDKDLTIDCQGCIIDANNAARIFNINDNTKNIVLKNIKFVNAVGVNGAAVYANCNNLEIINCTFENNHATSNGDALYLVANGCDITESTFINNIGTDSVIYLDSESDAATFNIDNSILVNNGGTNVVKAKGDLTAEYNWWGNTADNTNDLSEGLAQKWYVLDMAVDDSKSIASVSLNNLNAGTSYENYALPCVSLNMQATNGVPRKDEVVLDENGVGTVGYIATGDYATLTASYNGVSISREINYNPDSDYSFKALKKLIDQSNDNDVITLTHDYEYAVGYDDITTGSNSAITAGIDITQNNLTINGNGYTIDAKEKTRVFNIGVADYLIASNVIIKNTTFVNGKISGKGGSIRWYGWNGTLINCTFEDNSANTDGGAVYWYAQNGNITNCTFKNNAVTGYYNGGAIYVQSKNVNVVNSTFIENRAYNGGSIYINAENVNIINSTFDKSTAGNGGAIGVGKSNVIINNSTFTSNEASTYGGAVYLSSGNNIDIVDSTFNDNKASSYAGAIYSNANFNIKNSTFKGNKASSNAGAIYYANAGGTIYNATFIDNSANKGGAIYTYAGVIDINKTDFINNYAQGSSAYAGAIYDQSSDKLSIENSNFTGNYVKTTTSTAYGGVIYSGYGDISIVNSIFNRNSIDTTSGSTYGSVIWFGNSAKGEILNTSFLNNHGKSSFAAAMYGSGSGVEVDITNSIFLNNTYGDSNTLKVVHSYNSASFNFTDCWFGNTKDNSGESMGTTTGSTITYNNKLTLIAVHDEYMTVGEDKEIKFVLEYVENGKIVIYDSSKLPKVNLTLSSVNGDIDRNSVSMDETILFNANHFGSASITANYNGIEFTENLYAKDKPTITVDPIVVHVGESIGVNVIELIPSDASLSFLGIDGDEFILVAGNGYVEGLKEGSSTLYIKYNGNDDYSPATVEVPVTVIRYNTQINVKIDSNPIDSIDADWGTDPQSIVIAFSTDDPNPQYGEFDLKFKTNDTNVASFTANPNVITFGAVGTANITFYFEGSNRYYGCEKNITVTVGKVASSVTFSNNVTLDYEGSNATTITCQYCSVDQINVTVIDADNNVLSGKAVLEGNVITVSGLDAGKYTLRVTTTPDSNHTSVDATANITVNRIDSSVSFSNDVEFDYLSSGTTTLTLVGCSVDLVNISVVDHSEAVIAYENDVITVSNLTAGTYTLRVTTTPDGNHKSVDATASITVNRIDSSVEFSNDVEFDYLSSGTTTLINFDGCSVDEENITVENHPEAVISYENNIINVSGLGAGTYTLRVTTTPDGNHKSVDKTANINVNKIDSSITLSNTDMVYKYDESNTTALTLVGCSVDLANITVDGNNVAGVTYDAQTKVITVSGLDVGSHTLKVTTTPDENHTSVFATASITVNKVNSSITFSNPVSLFYSEEGSTTLTLIGCTVDEENITVLNHPEAVIRYDDSTNVITVSGLDQGTYTLKVITTPDKNHWSVEKTIGVSVDKESPRLAMESGNITVGENEFVFVSMGIIGDVNITIFKGDLVVKTENVTIGVAGFNKTTFNDLKVGTYIISAHYEGQGRYNSSTLMYDLVVRPVYEYEFTASVNDTVMGNKTNATVILPEGASGKITIGEIEHAVDGTKTVIELPEQNKFGKNNVTVKYVPDENSKYAPREVTALYDVAKVDTSISLAIDNRTTADPVIITATITAEGNVIFIINSMKYSRQIIGNTATLELADVAAGEYNVTAIYDGNEKYANSTANGTYTVEKIDTTISIEVTPSTIKTDESAIVTVTVQGSGIVTVCVNGIETNVTADDNGVATLPISKLPKGTTTISAKYWGDDKYNTNQTDEIALTVNPIAIENFSIDIVNVTVGDDAIAYLIIASDAANMTNITVKQGDAVLFTQNTTFKATIPDLGVGTYNITAYYYGDDKYDVAQISKEFSVNPLNMGKLNFTATVNSTFVGEKTNVTVKISDDATGIIKIGEIERTITGSEVIIELPAQTTAGLNNVTIQYIPDENSKYAEDNITAFYNVAKKSAEIIISDITGKKAGDIVEIVASAYEGADIIVYVDGVKTTTVENISAGKHTVVATVAETDEYLSASANKTFEVTKSDVGIITIVGTDVNVGEKSTITVTLVSDDATGIVEINVDGTKYSLNISETKTIDVVMNKVGEIQLSGRYLGDYKYDAKDVPGNKIAVSEKTTPEITIQTVPTSVVGDEMSINVTTDGYNLTVTVMLGNAVQKIANGSFKFTPAKDGAYTIIAKTTENKTHYGTESIASFTVINRTKLTPSIIISEIADAKVGREITFTVDATVGDGIIVKINDEIVTLKDGNYTYIPKTSGTYTLTVESEENEIYSKGIKTQTFTVDKNDASIKVSTTPVKVGEKSTIEIEVTPGATGLVIIDVAGSQYSITLPQTTLEVVLDKVGSYDVSARYLGDNNFTENGSDVVSLEVSQKAISNFTIQIPQDIKAGEKVTINVSCESQADLEVYVDGVKQTLADGKINIDSLKAGTHTIEVISPVTSTHMANTTTKTFSVSKKQADIQIDVEGELVADKNIRLNIESYSGAKLTVYMDGKVLDDWETPFKATAGDHLVFVSVEDNDEYFEATQNKTFSVAKKQSTIHVSGSHSIVGEKSIIEVDLTKGATGMVIVNVGGTEYSLNVSESDSISVVLNNARVYNISAKYMGDDKYLASESEVNTIVVEDKKATIIDVEMPQEISAGETFTINISSNNDVIEVLFDGVKKQIVEGKLTVEDIAAGIHKVEVIAIETSALKANSTSLSFYVVKKEAAINLALPENIILGSDVEINVTSYDGAEISVYVDGAKQTIKDGKVTVKATVGSHSIVATMAENDKYLSAMANKTFSVDKLVAEISVSGLNITEGQKTTIIIDTPLSEGIVHIKVGDAEAYVDLAKSKSIELQLDEPGDYEITASYLGGDNYKPVEAKATINVAKKETPNIDIANSGDANKSRIDIGLPSDATGIVTVTVDGNKTYSVDVVKGSASVDIADLSAGNHDVAVAYAGDDKYAPVNKTTTVDVSKVVIPENAPGLDASVVEGTTTAIVDVALSGDATGTVTVTLDGNKTYNATVVDGSASVEIPDLSVGTHNLTVAYSGDDKYSSVNKNSTLDVPKVVIPENSTDVDVKVLEDSSSAVVNVTLPDDASGTVTVVVDGNKTFNAAVVDGNAVVDLTDLGPGEHDLAITYSGSEKYDSLNKKAKVTVPKKDIENQTTVDVYPDGDSSAVVDVTLPEDASGIVTVTVDGDKTYNATVVDGNASVKLSNLTSGDHGISVAYMGDDKYGPVYKNTKVSIPKVTPSVLFSVRVETGDDSPIFTIKAPKDTDGSFIVSINGLNYIIKVVDGVGSIKVPKVGYGKFNVVYNFTGDEKYYSLTKNATVNIPKPVITANDVTMFYTDGSKYKVSLKINGKPIANQKVTITFNGEKYNVTTDRNGNAVFKIPDVKPLTGKYDITATFKGVSISNIVKVYRILVIDPIKVKKSANSIKIKVTLKKVNNRYLANKDITVKFNGAVYHAKTNSRGVAYVTIPKAVLNKLAAGKVYRYVATYEKDTWYKNIYVSR